MAIRQIMITSLMVFPVWVGMMGGAMAEITGMAEARDALQARVDSFHPLTDENLFALEQPFADILRARPGQDLASARDALEGAGFSWQRLNSGFLLLTDQKGTGLGHYLFRPGAGDGVMIQAPHQFYDRHTGQLAIDLFLESGASVLALNSAHRRLAVTDRTGNADIAHLDGTVFEPLTRAFALNQSDGVVLQLHGFSAEKRKSTAGREADIIVSSGQRWLQPVAERFASCLARVDRWQVRRYPVDVGELGGTTNTQGALLRRLGNNRFVHLELSRSLRDWLVSDDAELKTFSACFRAMTSDLS